MFFFYLSLNNQIHDISTLHDQIFLPRTKRKHNFSAWEDSFIVKTNRGLIWPAGLTNVVLQNVIHVRLRRLKKLFSLCSKL